MNDFFYLIILAFLPLIYKISFWLYLIQLKEYRWDRFKEYILTPQGKKAIFNILFFFEIFVLIIGILYLQNIVGFKLAYYSLVFLLQAESLYVFYKIFSLKFIVPKKTKRIIILALFIFLHFLTLLHWGYYNQNIFAFIILPSLLAFTYVYVMFWNNISSVFFDYAKEKIFNKAKEKIKKLNLNKIGITGSYGKSSEKEYLSEALKSKYKIIKTPKNINTEIGIANFILNNDFKKYKYFIVETGAYRKGEIKKVGEIINHKDGFLTGIGNQHIGLFGNQQNIIDAKFEIAEKVYENKGKLFLNISNIKYLDKKKIHIKDKLGIIDYIGKSPEILGKLIDNKQLISYGNNKNAKYKYEIIDLNEKGTKFKVNDFEFITNLIGNGQIENLSGTIAYLIENNWTKEDIQNAINNLKNPKKSLDIIKIKDNLNFDVVGNNKEITLIDDSYNLSVNSLINTIDLLEYFNGEKILVLDDILELGKKSKQIHKKLGEYVSNKVNKVFYLGINFKEDFVKGLKKGKFNGEILDKLPLVYNENSIIIFEGKKAGILLDSKLS